MRAVIKNASETHSGNLIWSKPYIYPKYELRNAINNLKNLGYWISSFPEGDGICFKHETKTEMNVFNDFRVSFPWMTITEYSTSKDFDYQKDIFDYQIVIMPLSRLKIDSIIHAGKYSIYPSSEFILDEINILKSRNPLRNYITDFTGTSKEVFESNPLIVFSTNSINYESYNQMDASQDEDLIRQLSNETNPIMDLVKYYHGEYFYPEIMSANAGLWDEKYSTAMIYFPSKNIAHYQAREVEVKTFIKSIGIDLISCDLIEVNPILNFELNETGNIAKHALRLNSNILESDDLTIKFVLIMTLFEYLAFPYDYKSFRVVKGKIGLHVADNKTEYDKLMIRFEELTAGLKKNDGSKDRIMGLRTSIIHLGKRIEDLIPLKEKQKELFQELQFYVKSVIDDMIAYSYLSWIDFEKEREKLKQRL